MEVVVVVVVLYYYCYNKYKFKYKFSTAACVDYGAMWLCDIPPVESRDPEEGSSLITVLTVSYGFCV